MTLRGTLHLPLQADIHSVQQREEASWEGAATIGTQHVCTVCAGQV